MEIILKLSFISVILFLSFFAFYFWGRKAIIFKNIPIDNLHLYFSILLYRGYTEKKSCPDGRLYIYNENGDRYVLLRKYKVRGNQIGVYIFIPLFEESIKSEIIEILENQEDKKHYWDDHLQEIDMLVVGVDIGMDMYWGVNFIKSVIEIVYDKKLENILFTLYFKNINESVTELTDFDVNTLDLNQFNGDLLMPIHKATKAAAELGKFHRKVRDFLMGRKQK